MQSYAEGDNIELPAREVMRAASTTICSEKFAEHAALTYTDNSELAQNQGCHADRSYP